MLNGGDYYFQFQVPTYTHFYSYSKLKEIQASKKFDYFVLINSQNIDYLQKVGASIPKIIQKLKVKVRTNQISTMEL